MPPKKGSKGKKGDGPIIDGVNTTEMTREQLEKFALRLREQCEREREERNYFQVERDKLRTYWELTKDQLEEVQAQLRNKDREIEECNEKNDLEIKTLRQKVKFLTYEHNNTIAELKAESMVSLKHAQDDHIEQEDELLADKMALKEKLKEQEVKFYEMIKSIKLQHSEEISKARSKFENKAKEFEDKFNREYEDIKIKLDEKHKMEMCEIEERKNSHIQDLIDNHEKQFNETKTYYNDVCLNNLAVISSMKAQIQELTDENERMAKQVICIENENKKLVEPLQIAQEENRELKRKMTNYTKDLTSLKNNKEILIKTKKKLDALTKENDVLEIKYDKLKTQHEILQDRFLDAILDVQENCSLKTVELQKRVETLDETLNHKEAVIAEMAAAAQLDPKAVNDKLAKLLLIKDNAIKDLKYQIARACKAHDDMLRTFEAKLEYYGIPKSEMGFIPMRVKDIGKGPTTLYTFNK